MTFPLRLTADLTLALAGRAIGNKHAHPLILQLSPDTDFDTASASLPEARRQAADTTPESGTLVSRNRSPILWIAGSEPLEYPEVARFTNALAASGRHVFLQTSGAALKRRLHEFQPSPHFYFTIRFDGSEPSLAQRDARDSAFRVGIEAIRMSRLAGFFTCVHLVVPPGGAARELEALHAEIGKLDVDGFLITRAAREPGLEKSVSQLRRRLLSRRWALLSDMVEDVAQPAASENSRQIDHQTISEPQAGSFEEGAEAG